MVKFLTNKAIAVINERRPLMNILGNVKKVPGGLMLIPMLIVAIINTFFPSALDIGSATTALFKSGTMCIIGIILFTAGTQLKLKALPQALARGGVFVLVRTIICVLTCVILKNTVGLDGVLGISLLAFVIVMSSCNPGVYAALMQQYGDGVDLAAMGIINIIAVPQFPLIILAIFFSDGSSGVSPLKIAVGTIIPFIIGLVLANLDENIGKLFAPATPIALIFLGCCFGSSLNLITAVKSGLAGILLGVIFVVVSMAILLPVDKFILRRPGYAAAAFASVGGVSIGAPAVIAAVLPEFEPYVSSASGQLAFAVIISAIVTPIITKTLAEKAKKNA
jgi:2-keto-3-deoxygluconate permease